MQHLHSPLSSGVDHHRFVCWKQDVIEFGATTYAMTAFLETSGATVSNLVTHVPMGTAWDLIESESRIISWRIKIQKVAPPPSTPLPQTTLTLSIIFMLGFNHGTLTVYSGSRSGTTSRTLIWEHPRTLDGYTSPVTCFESGSRCEHCWIAIADMNLFHNAAGSANLTNVFVGTAQQIAYGHGSVGFVVINNDASTWSETFTTSPPAGTSTTRIATLRHARD
ncbi:hypothetical protein B0H11DRAFT_1925088 [Mycena galericulata]|nr:hypothetical protein B0H11DRAFT_1925088 [Mycena galericulata]